jgi:hypothetical protein
MRPRVPDQPQWSTVAPAEVGSMSKDELPSVGDEVLYHADGKWCPAQVLAIRDNGELALLYDHNAELIHQRSVHGSHLYGWVTYKEAASGATMEANA